ncbi:MAG TPA: thioredoxin domain-containing protein [Thermoanaerobaculia bacterium]|nr:thioredoxin domain-containing protein [Thermoanaerobaculia bacterium]
MSRSTSRPTNRLAREKSPYLLQHAHNPVDWYPWGDEAFEKARGEDRPIFLSIGYSTCHWCHVMERESFEDEGVAALLNERYVAIKVDREERPDVDRVYMAAVQATTGSGGWPLSAWLTPDLQPFYTGTYFPPDARYGRPGFGQILVHLSEAWRNDREKVLAAALQVTTALAGLATAAPASSLAPPADSGAPAGPESLGPALELAARQLARAYDPRHGGFSDAPKFPRPSVYGFLLRYHHRTGDLAARDMTLHTLREMWAGGIHDHLEGGFHRYSVDALWRVPHFEKMLYDQAQLAWSYLDAWQLTRDSFFAGAAAEILDYVRQRLTHSEGGFLSAEDADSATDPSHPDEKEEGAFYLWEKAEVARVLEDPLELEAATGCWGISELGNTLHDPHGELGTRNVLFAARTSAQVARELELSPEDVEQALERARAKLRRQRAQRPRPYLDDKVLVAWNGLMISAAARASAALERPQDLELAARAARLVLERCSWRDGDRVRLYRRFRDGEAAVDGQLEDYAALALALLDLYLASFDEAWLQRSMLVVESMVATFHDPADGAFFDDPGTDRRVLVRTKEAYDGAEPSGNALAAEVLLRLGRLLQRSDLIGLAEGVVARFRPVLEQAPHAMAHMLQVVEAMMVPPEHVLIVGDPTLVGARELLRVARTTAYDPHRHVVLAPNEEATILQQLGIHLPSPGGGTDQAKAYACRSFACELPTTNPRELARLLEAWKPRAEAGL